MSGADEVTIIRTSHDYMVVVDPNGASPCVYTDRQGRAALRLAAQSLGLPNPQPIFPLPSWRNLPAIALTLIVGGATGDAITAAWDPVEPLPIVQQLEPDMSGDMSGIESLLASCLEGVRESVVTPLPDVTPIAAKVECPPVRCPVRTVEACHWKPEPLNMPEGE